MSDQDLSRVPCVDEQARVVEGQDTHLRKDYEVHNTPRGVKPESAQADRRCGSRCLRHAHVRYGRRTAVMLTKRKNSSIVYDSWTGHRISAPVHSSASCLRVPPCE